MANSDCAATLEEIVTAGAEKFGIELAPGAAQQFRRYFELLIERNAVMNLTAITGEREVAALHFLDSLAVLGALKESSRTLIDIGSGAGFPGLPMKIARPELEITLLDARAKRVEFLRDVAQELGLSNISCVAARSEEFVREHRESFDVATSRAVARLNELSELCLPLVRVGGIFVVMKSANFGDELDEAANAIKILGGEVESVREYEVPNSFGDGEDSRKNALIVIQKVYSTPEKYPRRYAKLQKSPL